MADKKILYKIVVRRGVKHIIEFRVKSISEKTITYYPRSQDSVGVKKLKVDDLDKVSITNDTFEITVNNSYVFTFDKSKLEAYKNDCINLYVKTLDDYAEKLKQITLGLFDVEWEESKIEKEKGNPNE